MSLLGFSRATLFDYLNPWSDLRIVLDEVLPRMLQAMKQETQVSAITFLPRPGSNRLSNANRELSDAKAGSCPFSKTARSRTQNVLNADVLATIRPETLVITAVNDCRFKEPPERKRHHQCCIESRQ